MKIVIDVNLSPTWVELFEAEGWETAHWSDIGDPRAPDKLILGWARERGFIVFTNDLDFGTLLALTRASGPSVIQVRALKLAPRDLGPLMIRALRQNREPLEAGALVTVDESSWRVKILPLVVG